MDHCCFTSEMDDDEDKEVNNQLYPFPVYPGYFKKQKP